MRTKTQKKRIVRGGLHWRVLAVLVVLCMLLNHLNYGLMVTYASSNDPLVFRIGENVTAELAEGVLRLSGTGETEDFVAETAPFRAYSAEIHELIIEGGITYIGSYLFFGLGELRGELILPESIVGFGEYAFSGGSSENAPHFSIIENHFVSGEVVRQEGKTEETPLPGEETTSLIADGTEQSEESVNKPEQEIESTIAGEPTSEEVSEPESETESETTSETVNEPESETTSETVNEPESETTSETVNEPESETTSETVNEPESETTSESVNEPESAPVSESESIPASEPESELAGEPEVEPTSGPEPASDPVLDNDTNPLPAEESGSGTAGTGSAIIKDSDSSEDTSDTRYIVERITEQEIVRPDTLFYPDQTGVVICYDENRTFLEAAQAAGYQLADSMATVTLDDKTVRKLPVTEGIVSLPECPAEISDSYENEVFRTYVFLGWTQSPEDESAPVLMPGELLQTEGKGDISLYSVWSENDTYELKVHVGTDGSTAVYTLLDSATDQAPADPDGYMLIYQWQIAAQDEGSLADWTDIEGANHAVYYRDLNPTDSGMQLRCAVTAVRILRTMSGDEPPVLYSPPVNALAQISTVYVDQKSGSDTNDGTIPSTSVKTLDAASKLLQTTEDGGTIDTNRIVILGVYTLSAAEQQLFAERPVPVTITGVEGTVLKGVNEVSSGNDYPLELHEDLCLESIQVELLNHIYGNGYNITIGDNVKNGTLGFYLYGSGRSALTSDTKVGALTVKSGYFSRIVGYVRSNPSVDCKNLKASITVEGTANVTMIVAGSASGEIKNANVEININGGTVGTLIGGNQGFSNSPSPFSGTTTINIAKGTVTNLYGAGSGRNKSIPTYSGELHINVSGGLVKNLYGAGSAAYVISEVDKPAKVRITVSGGQVDNLFAAGKGWDPNASLGKINGTDLNFDFVGGVKPEDFGSLTGSADIVVKGGTVGNIYASGEGYQLKNNTDSDTETQSNAYLDGHATIRVEGGTVKGSIYGGGKGIETSGYTECARVTKTSVVQVVVVGGTVEGNVYGGGQIAKVEGSTSVTLSGGIVEGNVYGGGDQGLVEGSATVNISSGTVNGSVYGGSLGTPKQVLVLNGSTINMTGGWVRGNLYGGSELSDDGTVLADNETIPDLVIVNLTGGTVSGNVFGGGYRGTVHGSTHLHIGAGALGDCKYYQGHTEKMPNLSSSALLTGGSVYAGGDFGGDGSDYNTVTVEGTSHVYIDGTGYDTGGGTDGETGIEMTVSGGVFGSGASCDAGKTRLVTLENYGNTVADTTDVITGATRSLTSIQRADRVLLLNSHVQLTGQADVANANQTALYTLNRIGDHGSVDGIGDLGNGLVLQGGSTLILNSAALELAGLRSLDACGSEIAIENINKSPKNTLLLNTGTLLRFSYTDRESDKEVYGPVKGYTYLLASESVEGYAYARISPDKDMPSESGAEKDGGFVDSDCKEISHTDVSEGDPPYRYWKVRGAGDSANVMRQAVLTARTLTEDQPGYSSDGYSVAKGIVELLPADAGSVYKIKSITLPDSSGLNLAEAAKNAQGDETKWTLSSTDIVQETEKNKISTSPLNTFGLYMRIGSGFTNTADAPGKVISAESVTTGGENTIIGHETAGSVSGNNVVPQIEFYLTYYNNGITASQDLGTVQIVLQRLVSGKEQETTTIELQILTRATNLSSMEVDLYATQTGSYTGKLYIPAGSSRKLTLQSVSPSEGASLVKDGSSLSGQQFTVSMQAIRNQGWQSSGLMEGPCDLGGFKSSDTVQLGTTDSRYEAPVEFILKNAPGFSAKNGADSVTLMLTEEGSKDSVTITLRIHWKNSVVSDISVGAGRQYNGLEKETSLKISQKSAMTAAFTLLGSTNADSLWLELWNEKKEAVRLPVGTELTLLTGTSFYRYRVAESETDVENKLSSFDSMGGNTSLTGTISGTIVVILDFGSSKADLAVGEYSLRMRNSGTADTIGADFTIDNTGATAAISGEGGLSKSSQSFTLTITQGSDTRFSGGAALALSSDAKTGFPEGTVFTLSGEKYYPSGGTVMIPLTSPMKEWQIFMDTTNTKGLLEGSHTLSAQIFPTGMNAGRTEALETNTTYQVQPNPSYGLAVSLKSGGSRVVPSGGSVLTFIAAYSVEHSAAESIAVSVQKKDGTVYGNIDSSSWNISGNGKLSSASGQQEISVTVPSGLDPGTYRLCFGLGDRSVPYNLIVTN